jgi:negative regulator of replication initiation
MLHLASPNSRLSVKDKVIFWLGEIYRNDKASFDKVLSIDGVYRSKSDVRREPAQIPGSPYWVETNISTPQKAIVLFKVLDALGFDAVSIVEVLKSVVYDSR